MKRSLFLIALSFFLLNSACTHGKEESYDKPVHTPVPEKKDPIKEKMESMTLKQKILQMFFVSPEQLTKGNTVTVYDETLENALNTYPVGGIIFFGDNIQNSEQTASLLGNTYAQSLKQGTPLFLGVDEEGGIVARIASNPSFGVSNEKPAVQLGDDAQEAGERIGTYLKKLGFNVDFAPVADVAVNGAAVGNRSFGTDAQYVSEEAHAFANGLKSQGVMSCYKHYPVFGRALASTDFQSVSIDASLDDLKSSDLIPYENAEDIPFVMAGNMAYPNITGSNVPACMSDVLVKNLLSDELGYKGIVITDALNARAITSYCDAGSAAVNCIQAGVDMLLIPEDLDTAYNAVLNAVNNGTITEERINQSVRKILTEKSKYLNK